MNTKSLFAAVIAATLLFAGQSPAHATNGGVPVEPRAAHKSISKGQKLLAGIIIGAAVATAIVKGRDGHRALNRHDFDDGPRFRKNRWSRRGGRHHRRNRFAGE